MRQNGACHSEHEVSFSCCTYCTCPCSCRHEFTSDGLLWHDNYSFNCSLTWGNLRIPYFTTASLMLKVKGRKSCELMNSETHKWLSLKDSQSCYNQCPCPRMKYQVKLRQTVEIMQRRNNPQDQALVKVCQHNNGEVCLWQTFQFKEFCPWSTNLKKKKSVVLLKKLLQVKLCFLWTQRQTDTRGEIKGQTSRASNSWEKKKIKLKSIALWLSY